MNSKGGRISYFLRLKIFSVQPLRKLLYIANNRRSTYLKRFSCVATSEDKKLMMKYLWKYGLSYEDFYFFDVKENDPATFISECYRWKYYKKLNTKKGSKVYADKGETYKVFSDLYGRDLVTVYSKRDYDEFLKHNPGFVYKDSINGCGKGIKLYKTGETDKEELWENLKNRVPFIMEQPIVQSEEMARFHPESVNTVRIVTVLKGNDKTGYTVEAFAPFMKVGKGNSFVDNGGAGGIMCSVGMDGTITSDGIDELVNIYMEHPDTHIVFKGQKLPEFEKAIIVAKTAALRYTENRLVGWDVAHSMEKGWIIVEGNSFGQFIGQQMCDKIGKKQEFEEIISEI